jgi:uncharacterized Fe-S cluster protein YjdI/CDGSH-type Zn-finger protein
LGEFQGWITSSVGYLVQYGTLPVISQTKEKREALLVKAIDVWRSNRYEELSWDRIVGQWVTGTANLWLRKTSSALVALNAIPSHVDTTQWLDLRILKAGLGIELALHLNNPELNLSRYLNELRQLLTEIDGIKPYTSSDITVYYNARLCIHAAECVRGLPQVFDTSKKPWIEPSNSSANAVAEVIHRCPSRALRYERLDGGASEPIPDEVTGTFAENGPLYLRGNLRLEDAAGKILFEGTRVALCRCGASSNKPFCDRSHQGVNFQAARGLLESENGNSNE